MHLYNYPLKGRLLAKVTGALWKNSVIAPIAASNNVQPADIEKFKKSKAFKEFADQKVTGILANVSY